MPYAVLEYLLDGPDHLDLTVIGSIVELGEGYVAKILAFLFLHIILYINAEILLGGVIGSLRLTHQTSTKKKIHQKTLIPPLSPGLPPHQT